MHVSFAKWNQTRSGGHRTRPWLVRAWLMGRATLAPYVNRALAPLVFPRWRDTTGQPRPRLRYFLFRSRLALRSRAAVAVGDREHTHATPIRPSFASPPGITRARTPAWDRVQRARSAPSLSDPVAAANVGGCAVPCRAVRIELVMRWARACI
jgi:hypothetical protein